MIRTEIEAYNSTYGALFRLYYGVSWRSQDRACIAIAGFHNKRESEHQERRFEARYIIA